MSDLREWLDQQQPAEELVTVRGKQFLIVELDLAQRARLFAENVKDADKSDTVIECLLLSRCVLDPSTREQLVPTADWKYWQTKPSGLSALLAAVLRVNGLRGDDPVETEAKNLDATTG